MTHIGTCIICPAPAWYHTAWARANVKLYLFSSIASFVVVKLKSWNGVWGKGHSIISVPVTKSVTLSCNTVQYGSGKAAITSPIALIQSWIFVAGMTTNPLVTTSRRPLPTMLGATGSVMSSTQVTYSECADGFGYSLNLQSVFGKCDLPVIAVMMLRAFFLINGIHCGTYQTYFHHNIWGWQLIFLNILKKIKSFII